MVFMQAQVMMRNPYETYRTQGVMTASPMELIIMLYDALKKNLLLAKKALDNKDAATAHAKLIRAQDILGELVNSLDMSVEISKNLLDIYEYIIHELIEINLKKDPSGISAVLELIEPLREAWKEINASQKGQLSLNEG